ncbi:M48 family metallopeptidase [Rhodoferax sp.]|uniref:M48 family metallopeptidase n=1 Tax=Rhodoferax sp. TaxID=50421 RepID=UPI00261D0C77|nr:M48 family metallopeptidase [Rhodoferax sp.]MDD2926805.1 M48 family metallopeptidase [Rhodoferax sp.]
MSVSSARATPAAPAVLRATYFDGRSARPQPVHIWLADGQLHVRGESWARSLPWQAVNWPERTRQGMRVAHLADGGLVQSEDSAAWDAWASSHGLREPLVVKMQQNWRWVMGSVVVLLGLVIAVQQWGLPLAARALVALTPPALETALGESTLTAVDRLIMQPSQLPVASQTRVRDAFAQALTHQPAGSVRPWQLVFRKSRLGPNALALPGGTIIMTDEMVTLVDGDTQVLSAVLAHELGHVQQRHGLRMLVQATVLGTLSAVVLGDFSSVLATVPALLGQAHYSRQAEREADAHAVKVLKAASLSPAVMVTLFDKLKARRAASQPKGQPASDAGSSGAWLGIAFSSHPSDAERVAFFQTAAR